ncbi:hypothetical protein MO973_38325 [Paenibacillus sp. TRM 82003]|uniref:hypothetical protein n=1 Tax=Kineococcus sp. TRM81007 TaxID=2925831 RepID=UPI001F5953AE|nr:hypothetical protein [Kineococcus sp. TRM81007]MCI2238048.1 hypothetical protein [Kineococcus sp. TRM81007]MCI3926063.1 hypothetical protein [Paenibacillus sp. TRM 82003]
MASGDAQRGPGEDRPEPGEQREQGGEEPGEDRPGEDRSAWLLVLAPALPLLPAAESCRRFLAGARDREHFGWRTGEGFAGPGDEEVALGLTDRWPAMLDAIPVSTALLASVVGLLAVTGAALAGRPGLPAPGRVQRRAGAVVAALVLLGALGLAAGSLATVSRSGQVDEELPFFVLDTWGWLEASVPLGTAALAAALAVACGAVLLRPPASPTTASTTSAPATAPPTEGPTEPPAEPPAELPAEAPAGQAPPPPAGAGREPGPPPAPPPAPPAGDVGVGAGDGAAAVPGGPPRLRAEDRALYRRPPRVPGEPPGGGAPH